MTQNGSNSERSYESESSSDEYRGWNGYQTDSSDSGRDDDEPTLRAGELGGSSENFRRRSNKHSH